MTILVHYLRVTRQVQPIPVAVQSKGACTHTGFLPESDPAPVVEFFTRTALALPLPMVSLILNAAQERCLYIEIGGATCQRCYILGNIVSKHLSQYSVEKIESFNKKENTEL